MLSLQAVCVGGRSGSGGDCNNQAKKHTFVGDHHLSYRLTEMVEDEGNGKTEQTKDSGQQLEQSMTMKRMTKMTIICCFVLCELTDASLVGWWWWLTGLNTLTKCTSTYYCQCHWSRKKKRRKSRFGKSLSGTVVKRSGKHRMTIIRLMTTLTSTVKMAFLLEKLLVATK